MMSADLPVQVPTRSTSYQNSQGRLALFHYTLCDTFGLIAQSIKLLAIALWPPRGGWALSDAPVP